MTTHRTSTAIGPGHHDQDRGATLLELMVTVTLMAIVAGLAIATFGAIDVEAAGGCRADERRLESVVEWYFVQRDTDAIVATGRDHDRFEQTLVDEEFLQAPSTFHDLDATGAVIPQENSTC